MRGGGRVSNTGQARRAPWPARVGGGVRAVLLGLRGALRARLELRGLQLGGAHPGEVPAGQQRLACGRVAGQRRLGEDVHLLVVLALLLLRLLLLLLGLLLLLAVLVAALRLVAFLGGLRRQLLENVRDLARG